MHIPTPNADIRALLSAGPSVSSISHSRMKDGPPVFDAQDVRDAQNSLDLLMRDIFVSFEIGRSYFSDKSVEYFRNVEDRTREQAKSDTQNLIRTLEKGGISNNRFEETMRTLGFEIIDRSVTFKDDLGEVHTFSTSKTKDKYNHV